MAAETLDEFFKKRIVNAEPVEWKGPFPDPYSSSTPEEAKAFEAEIRKPISKAPKVLEAPPIDVETKVKEVAQPVKPEVAAVAAASPKVTPEMLDQIRSSMAQPALAEVSSSETLPPQAAVAPEKIDLKAIRQQVEQEGPQLGLTDALLGLIPVGIDAFTGGYGGGLDVGAKYYTDKVKDNEKRKQTLEDFLLKSAQARSIAGAKKSASAKLPTASNLVPVVAPDGTVKYEWAGKAAGMEKPEADKSGLSLEDWMKREQFKARLKALGNKEKLSKDEEKEKRQLEMTLSQRWETNKFTQGTRDVAASYNRIAKISPDNSTPIDDMGAIFDLMKALDPASVVRESEQAMAIGARSYGDVVSYFSQIMSGERKLTPQQVRNIQKFAKRLHDNRIQEQKKVDAGFLQKAESYGLNPANVVQNISENHAVQWKGKTIFFSTKEEADAARKTAEEYEKAQKGNK